MDVRRAYRTLVEVARQKNMKVEDVIAEIEIAMSKAIEISNKKNDVVALEAWRNIPCKGKVPTAVELVSYLGQRYVDEVNSLQRRTSSCIKNDKTIS